MCRSIKTLRSLPEPATPIDIEAAALQYVRKISGYRVPSRGNAEVFDRAVREISDATARLLADLIVPAHSKAKAAAGRAG
jgi:hypothetical protein